MLKTKNKVIYVMLICALLCMYVSTSASAEKLSAAAGNETPPEGNETISGIELDLSSADAHRSRGRAEIEKLFPAYENSAAKVENSAKTETFSHPPESSRELSIIYEQQETQKADISSSEAKTATNPWHSPILLITVVVISFRLAIYIISRIWR